MSLPFTHNVVAVSLLNEALEIHQAQKARGLAGLLEHLPCKNSVDIAGPEWAQRSSTWRLTHIGDDGFFSLALHSCSTRTDTAETFCYSRNSMVGWVTWALHRSMLGDELFQQAWPDAPLLRS